MRKHGDMVTITNECTCQKVVWFKLNAACRNECEFWLWFKLDALFSLVSIHNKLNLQPRMASRTPSIRWVTRLALSFSWIPNQCLRWSSINGSLNRRTEEKETEETSFPHYRESDIQLLEGFSISCLTRLIYSSSWVWTNLPSWKWWWKLREVTRDMINPQFRRTNYDCNSDFWLGWL